jgi:ATP-dependent helicase/nuclease subunit B
LPLHLLLQQGITVLTASRRLAHAARASYGSFAQQQGLEVWRTPRVLPWNTWLRQQHLEARARGSASARTQALSAAQARILWDEVVARSALAAELLNPASAARLAARSWRRLNDYLIPLESLRPFETPEARALFEWCNAFAQRCATLGAIDEARLAQWAHESHFEPGERVALAGFDTVPPAMQRLLARWREQGMLVELPDESQVNGRASIIAAADSQDEIRQAARWACSQWRSGAGEVGVIVSDLQSRREEIRRTFEDVIAPGTRRTQSQVASMPVVIAAPAPLTSFPMVDAALAVLQLAAGTGQGASTLAGRILRSPFIAGGESERGQRALADLRLREEQRDSWDWMELERWADITGCEQLRDTTRRLNQLLRDMSSTATASAWAERFHSVWRCLGWPGERTLNSDEHQTLQKVSSGLADFGALDTIAGRMNLRQALGQLRDLLADTPFEPETRASGITVIDAATSAGMTFGALWVAGLSADRWPAALNPDPLIPLELQRAANIPDATAAGMLELAKAQLNRWQRGAGSIVFSWPQRDGDIEFTRSPLLATVAAIPDSPVPTDDNIPLRTLIFRARPVLESIRDDRAPEVPPRQARGGARTVELQARCPFRAQVELRLRAGVVPHVGVGVEPKDRGSILHLVLADIWTSLRTHANLVSSDDAALAARVREVTQRHVAKTLMPTSRHASRLAELEIESVVHQVLRLLALEKARPPFVVRFAEAPEPYVIGGLALNLRPDRIDVLESGGELLIDYKLGDSHKVGDWLDVLPGRPRRPQLPLYGLAHEGELQALAYVVLSPRAVEYRGWSRDPGVAAGVLPYPSGTRIDLGDPQDWEALLHYWRFALTRLAERYVAGDAQVDPLRDECRTCHLSTLCRVHEVVLADADEEERHDDE